MVYIPQGTFMMGSDGAGFNQDEAPQHKVTISKGFRMSATEITNLQYEQFRPSHKELRGKGGFSSGDDEAVVFVETIPTPDRSGMGICLQGRNRH